MQNLSATHLLVPAAKPMCQRADQLTNIQGCTEPNAQTGRLSKKEILGSREAC